jgi:DNA (cytosine-5)-methyltransferase 1
MQKEKRSHPRIPVIDIFAGPGGLSEGFSSKRSTGGGRRFNIKLSIEKDPVAHSTLMLRSFLRQFRNPPHAYYEFLRGELPLSDLYALYPEKATRAAHDAVCIELGRKTRRTTDQLISQALGPKPGPWVLIGGPPCQAYSLVGRSRMKGEDPGAYEKDGRHYLYREYLHILEKFQPPVFVMENVKGILSSTVGGRGIFSDILRDLRKCGYTIHSFAHESKNGKEPKPADFVIRCEQYGIPQARHRVVLLGVRNDLRRGSSLLERQRKPATVKQAIGDLPPIRSGISEVDKQGAVWMTAVRATEHIGMPRDVVTEVRRTLKRSMPKSMGHDFLSRPGNRLRTSTWLTKNRAWFHDRKLAGVLHHSGRSHMQEDLKRYLFAACFAKIRGSSPKLENFPKELWPKHRNAAKAAKGKMFSDRFRVQVANRPASTVVSHISKDGHYYIHFDPVQCRSLTVREAARLQTFPDNYFFVGGRTAKYHQVGNAVPPLLARQLAAVVSSVLKQC